jgi:hypothetical protein
LAEKHLNEPYKVTLSSRVLGWFSVIPKALLSAALKRYATIIFFEEIAATILLFSCVIFVATVLARSVPINGTVMTEIAGWIR